MLKLFSMLMLCLVLCAVFARAEDADVKFVLVGDSTVTDGSGWGLGLKRLLAPGVGYVNYAQNGRSSKSFRDEGHWKKVIAEKSGYVLIQFGHNDCPGKGPERETDPATTFYENMARYVDEARAAGMKPVLVTSMTRRLFKGGKIQSDLKAYADATAKVAADKKVPLVDLHARSIEFLDKLGSEEAESLNPPPVKGKDGQPKADRTHLSAKGADLMAALVVDELRKAVPELAKAFK